MRPIKVIYIYGTSFSGSTLLSEAISMAEKIVNGGQLHKFFLDTYGVNSNYYCSCGHLITECPFWTSVISKLAWASSDVGLKKIAQITRKYEKLRNLLHIEPKKYEDWGTYHAMQFDLFSAIQETTDSQWIVDASKYPMRGFLLSQIQGLTLYNIHIIRNGYSYLQSTLKRPNHFITMRNNKYFSYFLISLDWLIINLGAEISILRSKRPTIRIMLEDFLSDPEETFLTLSKTLNHISLAKIGKRLADGEKVPYVHTTGNEGRLKGAQSLERNIPNIQLPYIAKLIFNITAGWLARRYGYKLSW